MPCDWCKKICFHKRKGRGRRACVSSDKTNQQCGASTPPSGVKRTNSRFMPLYGHIIPPHCDNMPPHCHMPPNCTAMPQPRITLPPSCSTMPPHCPMPPHRHMPQHCAAMPQPRLILPPSCSTMPPHGMAVPPIRDLSPSDHLPPPCSVMLPPCSNKPPHYAGMSSFCDNSPLCANNPSRTERLQKPSCSSITKPRTSIPSSQPSRSQTSVLVSTRGSSTVEASTNHRNGCLSDLCNTSVQATDEEDKECPTIRVLKEQLLIEPGRRMYPQDANHRAPCWIPPGRLKFPERTHNQPIPLGEDNACWIEAESYGLPTSDESKGVRREPCCQTKKPFEEMFPTPVEKCQVPNCPRSFLDVHGRQNKEFSKTSDASFCSKASLEECCKNPKIDLDEVRCCKTPITVSEIKSQDPKSVCECIYPPAYRQYGCSGNINGNCACRK